MPEELVEALIADVYTTMMDTFQTILGSSLSFNGRLQATLPILMRGFGLSRAFHLSPDFKIKQSRLRSYLVHLIIIYKPQNDFFLGALAQDFQTL